MAMQINMNAFNGQNTIMRGNYGDVVTHIENSGGTDSEKITVLFSCLSQAHHLHGPYKGECISTFEAKIYSIVRRSPEEVVEVAQGVRFAHNKPLEKMIEKIFYLVKNRFISERENYYIKGTKFSHHLTKIFKSLSNSSVGVGLGLVTLGTLSLAYTGITQLLSSDEGDESKKQGMAIPLIIIGSALTIAPFFEAAVKSASDEPV